MDKTVCELFAGVGGFRLGLEKSSPEWKTVWFSQWEPGKKNQWAHDCYVKHFGDIDEKTGWDISAVKKEEIPDHNLLVGGFPCQDYSVARPLPGSTGIQGKKGVLWWQIRDILQVKRPSFVLLENVDRLLKSPSSQRGRDFGVMLACFSSLGYSVEWRIVNAAEYGAAQRRRRIFIYAYDNKTGYARRVSKDPKMIMDSEGFFTKTFPIDEINSFSSVAFGQKTIAEISESFSFEFQNAGFMTNGSIFTCKIKPRKESPTPLKDILQDNVPEKFYISRDIDKWQYLKGAKKLQRTSKTGHEYTFSEGSIAFPDPIELPARTMLTSESSLNRSTHIINDPVTNRLRLLTPLEAERIQGFDDEWTNTGMPEKFRYFTMGNALVVPMVTRMGRTLDHILALE